jgi:Domain of unknown function (DUF5664)
MSANPKKAAGRAKPAMSFVPPSALLLEAVVMRLGASKYDPFNWQADPIDATTYYDAAMRHLMSWFTGEDNDPQSGVSHLAHVRACCGILIDSIESGILIDNRPRTTSAAALIERLANAEMVTQSWADAAMADAAIVVDAQ